MADLYAHQIQLTREKVAVVSACDYEALTSHKWHAAQFSNGRIWYARGQINGETVFMHRHISGLKKGNPLVVDHINGDGLDNRRENLRVVTQSENILNNRVISASSGFRGVFEQSGKYCARIKQNGKDYYLGFYETSVEAAFAVNQKLDELRPMFGVRNEIDYDALIEILQQRKEQIQRNLDVVLARRRTHEQG